MASLGRRHVPGDAQASGTLPVSAACDAPSVVIPSLPAHSARRESVGWPCGIVNDRCSDLMEDGRHMSQGARMAWHFPCHEPHAPLAGKGEGATRTALTDA